MRHKDEQLPEDTAHKILELAARYYTEQTNQEQEKGYTIDELMLARRQKYQKPGQYCRS